MVVTTAVMLPTLVGRAESVTVRVVDVADETVPVAPLVRTTVLLLAVVSKPTPLMVRVVPEAARSTVLAVTTGVTDPIWTAAPLSTPLEVTMAVRFPAFGLVVYVTVRDVAVAEVTVPTAPLLNLTKLFSAVVLKFVPAIVTVVASAACVAEVLSVTVGALTFATSCAT